MRTAGFLSGKKLGLDFRVWTVMALVCFFSVGLYGYKRLQIDPVNDSGCVPAAITVDGKEINNTTLCYLSRLSLFEIQTTDAAKVRWRFGDGTSAVSGRLVPHTFTKKGTYTISAAVNGRCTYEVVITVSDRIDVKAHEKTLVTIFTEPSNPKPGSPVTFYGVANIPVRSYEWNVSGTTDVQTDSVATFTFGAAATYTVRLMINNDPSTLTTKNINVVADAPQTPEPSATGDLNAGALTNSGGLPRDLIQAGEDPFNKSNQLPTDNKHGAANGANQPDTSKQAATPKAAAIDPNTFAGLLQDVTDGNKEIQDLYEYLCYKGTTKVQVNGKMPLVNVTAFCRDMQGKKGSKIEAVNFARDENKCIQTIQVSIQKKKRFIDKLNPFKKD